jgi:hypothetical protein
MQDIPLPISLPFEDSEEGASCQVYVLPHKTYGEMQGSRLVELYGIGTERFRTDTSKPHEYIHWTKTDNLLLFNNILKGKTEVILSLSKPTDDAQIITIFLPPGELIDSLQIGKHHYKLRDIIHIMEDVLIEKFLKRYENRVIKPKINTSLEVTCQPMKKGLVVFGRKGYSYLLRK